MANPGLLGHASKPPLGAASEALRLLCSSRARRRGNSGCWVLGKRAILLKHTLLLSQVSFFDFVLLAPNF